VENVLDYFLDYPESWPGQRVFVCPIDIIMIF
jgi:hypothetical protein